MNIYCSSIPDAKIINVGDEINISNLSQIVYLKRYMSSPGTLTFNKYIRICFRDELEILSDLMNDSYSSNKHSRILQSLFVQQIKLANSFLVLMTNNIETGQASLIRIMHEIYIKISFILISTKYHEGYVNNFVRNDIKTVKRRLNHLISSESMNIKGQILKLNKCINRCTKRLKKDANDLNDILRRHIYLYKKSAYKDQLKEILNESEIKSLVKANKTDDKNIKNDMHINKISDDVNDKLYSDLCLEIHSNIFDMVKKNSLSKDSGNRYKSNMKNSNKYNSSVIYFIRDVIIILRDTFYILYDCGILKCKKNDNTLSNIDDILNEIVANIIQSIN